MKAEPKDPGEAHARARPGAGADQVQVGLAVDLPAAEEEQVDPSLAGQVEQFARALGEGIAAALVQQGQLHRMAHQLHQPAGRGRDGGGGTNRDVARRRRGGVQDQPRQRGGEAFLRGDRAHAAAAFCAVPNTSRSSQARKPSSVFAARA